MSVWELFLTAVGLSMDAFAVAVCMSLAIPEAKWKTALTVGFYFGSFQALMPAIGFLLGTQFADRIVSLDHWIAFILLGIIGGKMIKESLSKEEADKSTQDSTHWKKMLPLALATSIDALALGISFSFLKVDMLSTVSFIGVITLVLSVMGVRIGKIMGKRFKSRAEMAGGVILVFLGIKILVEHTGIINL